MWGQWEGHSTARPGPQGSAGGCQPLAVPSGAVARSWHSASLRNPRELLPRAASAGQEALTGPLCPWSCWIQGRSRGRAVPGENSWKMKPTNPGREHLEKETPQAECSLKLYQDHNPNLPLGMDRDGPRCGHTAQGSLCSQSSPTAAQPPTETSTHRNPPVPEPEGSHLAPFQRGRPRRGRKL